MPVYVQHEVLARINDVFNAEALWQAPGLSLFSRRPLLRDLLELCVVEALEVLGSVDAVEQAGHGGWRNGRC